MARIDEQIREACDRSLPAPAMVREITAEGMALRLTVADDGGRELSVMVSPPGRARAVCARSDCFDVAVVGEQGGDGEEALQSMLSDVVTVITGIQGPFGEDDWKETLGEYADARFFGGPSVEIKLVRSCNQRCVFCKTPDEPDNYLPAVEVPAALKRLARHGRLLTLSGGETCLDPMLATHVRTAREAGFEQVEIQSNGMLLEDAGYARSLVDAGVTSFLISLHSHVPALSDAITRRRGGYDLTLRGIENALQLPVDVSLCHVICNLNHLYTADYTRWVKGRFRGAGMGIVFTYSVPTHRVRTDPSLMPRLSELSGPLMQALQICEPMALRERRPGRSLGDMAPRLDPAWRMLVRGYRRLRGGRLRAHVLASCGLPPCMLPGYEDYHDEYTHAQVCAAEAELSKPPVCRECIYEGRCSGIWRLYRSVHGDDEIRPVTGARP